MKAVVQRVKAASLKVQGRLVSEIPFGLVVFFGVKVGDDEAKADYIVKKIANLRIFEDEDGKMNLSVKDVGGEVLFVSQFTLYGDASHGNRPGFTLAERARARRAFVPLCGGKAGGTGRTRKNGDIRRGYEDRTAERRPRHYFAGGRITGGV